MVTEKTGDIFEEFENGGINVLIQQCNNFHTMGGGIARIIAEKFPIASEVDKKTLRGDRDKLGTFSVAILPDGRRIVNIYSQHDTSAMQNTQDDIQDNIEIAMEKAKRATRYDAIVAALETLRDSIASSKNPAKFKLGIPYGYGSDLAGGRFSVVRAIIKTVFDDSGIEVVIVKLPNAKNLE